MRISGGRLRSVRGSLRAPLESSKGRWHERAGLLLELDDGEGRVGQGEASPLPGYSPDTFEQCRGALEVALATGLGPFDLALPLGDQIALALAPQGSMPSAARFALETALLDLAGQRLDRSLASLLRPTELGPPREIPLAAGLSGTSIESALADGEAAVARGIRTLKVKIGRPGAFGQEVALLEALRRRFGHGVLLRLDANGAFSRAEAPERLRRLACLRPEFVEEPIAGAGLEALRGSPVRLAADESLQQPGAFERLIPSLRAGVTSAIVLKPAALGGLFACLALAARARSLGAACVVGHCWDGPVGLAAAGALALALGDGAMACGLDRHAGLSIWPEVPLPLFGPASIQPGSSPGLGIQRRVLP